MKSFTIDNLRMKALSHLLGKEGNEQVVFVITDTGKRRPPRSFEIPKTQNFFNNLSFPQSCRSWTARWGRARKLAIEWWNLRWKISYRSPTVPSTARSWARFSRGIQFPLERIFSSNFCKTLCFFRCANCCWSSCGHNSEIWQPIHQHVTLLFVFYCTLIAYSRRNTFNDRLIINVALYWYRKMNRPCRFENY